MTSCLFFLYEASHMTPEKNTHLSDRAFLPLQKYGCPGVTSIIIFLQLIMLLSRAPSQLMPCCYWLLHPRQHYSKPDAIGEKLPYRAMMYSYNSKKNFLVYLIHLSKLILIRISILKIFNTIFKSGKIFTV